MIRISQYDPRIISIEMGWHAVYTDLPPLKTEVSMEIILTI